MIRVLDARGSVRGDLILHPVALVSLVVLLVNDHVLKFAAPGWVTGKLSDVAGLAFFPFFVVAVREVLVRRAPTLVSASGAAALTAVVFAAVKLSSDARELCSGAVGVLRYPVDALLTGATSPVPVLIQPDASDVVAVVACAAVVVVLWRRTSTRPVGASGDAPRTIDPCLPGRRSRHVTA